LGKAVGEILFFKVYGFKPLKTSDFLVTEIPHSQVGDRNISQTGW